MAAPEKQPRPYRARGVPPAPLQRLPFTVLSSRNDIIDAALWQVLRDVLLWARTLAGERRLLFDPSSPAIRKRLAEAADAAPLLADPLASLARLRQVPGEVGAARIAVACDQVHDWAERGGLRAIATHFAEAAAYAEPGNPRWCIHSGYIDRISGGLDMFGRSEAWYSRAYVLAVQQREREMALRALIGAGALMADRGEYAKARRYYVRAARRAERQGRKRRAAVALHYAFMVDVETGHFRVAVRDAKAALRNYPLHDERIPALAHDVAYLLIRNQHYGSALRLVDRLGERVDGIAAMGMLYGITARAAAGAGREASCSAAAESALNIARINDECAGPVFVNLAEAARFRGHWEAAAGHAGRALAVAQQRADAEVERLAVELLRQIKRREAPPPASEPESGAPIAALARRLAARVRRWRRYNRGVGMQV
jgi:tetratricopeptide (TPR) repeat protein